ncbi:MAG: type II toxin-antitoxin system RelB/DinJ family antitoxin [Roseburia faecis]
MGKTATLNIRVNPDVKENAESVLAQLGIPMATAIDMYLKQISLVGGIPFSIVLLHMAHPNGRVCGAKRPKCEAERSHHL